MESVKIVLSCVLAAIIYGSLHDQITARICVEYFTIFHPPIFHTQSPTLLGLGWGIVATWWAGAEVGLMLTIAARFGSRALVPARQLLPLITLLMITMALCALVCGVIGYYFGTVPIDIAPAIPLDRQHRFVATWWAHTASYGSGFVGGLVLCIIISIRRIRSIRTTSAIIKA
jgi:hypothetical protein